LPLNNHLSPQGTPMEALRGDPWNTEGVPPTNTVEILWTVRANPVEKLRAK
jgi:hypothetical protein